MFLPCRCVYWLELELEDLLVLLELRLPAYPVLDVVAFLEMLAFIPALDPVLELMLLVAFKPILDPVLAAPVPVTTNWPFMFGWTSLLKK